MHKLLMIITLFVTSFFSFAQNEKRIDWTLSMEQVKSEEKNKLLEEKQRNLTFEARLYDLDFHLEYVFDEQGKLDNILYYRSLTVDEQNCISEYHSIKNKVSQEFGTTKTQESVYNDKAKDSAEKLCSFAATGEYKLETTWKGQAVDIELVLNTWKGIPYIGLYYRKSSH